MHWSDSFKAWQIYEIELKSKAFFRSYHSPSYFKGWAINQDTNFDALNKFEARLGGKSYQWV